MFSLSPYIIRPVRSSFPLWLFFSAEIFFSDSFTIALLRSWLMFVKASVLTLHSFVQVSSPVSYIAFSQEALGSFHWHISQSSLGFSSLFDIGCGGFPFVVQKGSRWTPATVAEAISKHIDAPVSCHLAMRQTWSGVWQDVLRGWVTSRDVAFLYASWCENSLSYSGDGGIAYCIDFYLIFTLSPTSLYFISL